MCVSLFAAMVPSVSRYASGILRSISPSISVNPADMEANSDLIVDDDPDDRKAGLDELLYDLLAMICSLNDKTPQSTRGRKQGMVARLEGVSDRAIGQVEM